MKLTKWTLVALGMSLSVGAGLTACGGKDNVIDDGVGGEGGGGPAGCEPNATQCASDGAVEQCREDGSGWLVTACASGESCVDGACQPSGICSPGESVCTSDSTRVTCSADGSGYEEVECPDTAPCVDGVCKGAVCNAGETRCDPNAGKLTSFFEGEGTYPDLNVVWECVDGLRWEAQRCDAGQLCNYDRLAEPVDWAELRFDLYFMGESGIMPELPEPAAGATASCTTPACGDGSLMGFFEGDMTCGDAEDSGASVEDRYSVCQGFAPFANSFWEVSECAAPTTCSGDLDQPCSSECVPGETQCYNHFLQECGEDGKWVVGTQCLATDGGPGQCRARTGAGYGTRTASCIDPVCNYWGFESSWVGPDYEAAGACDGDQIQVCNEDGRLEDAEDCPSGGSCTAYYEYGQYGGRVPGVCLTPCEDGARRCYGGTFFNECVDGEWVLDSCAQGESCINVGEDDTICGECTPGSSYCDGNTIVECGDDGQYEDVEDGEECTFGACAEQYNQVIQENIAHCQADCVPGSIQCTDGSGNAGYSSYARECDENGLWGAPTICAVGLCLNDSSGKALGCVDCVGSKNQGFNAPDSACDGTQIMRCNDDNEWEEAEDCPDDRVCSGTTSSSAAYADYSRAAVCVVPSEEVVVDAAN